MKNKGISYKIIILFLFVFGLAAILLASFRLANDGATYQNDLMESVQPNTPWGTP